MINNFQRDAGQEDDRDSGSLSLITTLLQGDQVTPLRLTLHSKARNPALSSG